MCGVRRQAIILAPLLGSEAPTARSGAFGSGVSQRAAPPDRTPPLETSTRMIATERTHELRRSGSGRSGPSEGLVDGVGGLPRGGSSAPRALTPTETVLHLVKGNVGPGILALPYHFARAGPFRAAVVTACVVTQGVLGMRMLVRVQGMAAARGVTRDQLDGSSNSDGGDGVTCAGSCVTRAGNGVTCGGSGVSGCGSGGATSAASTGRAAPLTFEQVGEVCFGRVGRRGVILSVLTLQLGVCAVFIGLIGANLEAALSSVFDLHVTRPEALLLAFIPCALLSQLRDISELWPLSLFGNLSMVTALFSTAIAAVITLGDPAAAFVTPPPPTPHATPHAPEQTLASELLAAAACASAAFYAFEGVCLVLPVGNAFSGGKEEGKPLGACCIAHCTHARVTRARSHADAYPTRVHFVHCVSSPTNTSTSHTGRRGYMRLLTLTLTGVGCAFVLIGTLAGLAFPSNSPASITPYLQVSRPPPPAPPPIMPICRPRPFLFRICTTRFVFSLTPAQLASAHSAPTAAFFATVNMLVVASCLATLPLQLTPAALIVAESLRLGGAAHRLARLLLVCVCASCALLLPTLDQLIDLFGAVACTALAALPWAMHMRLELLARGEESSRLVVPSEARRGALPEMMGPGIEHAAVSTVAEGGEGGAVETEQAHWHGRWEDAGAAQRNVWPLVVDGAFIVLCAVVMVCGVTQALQRL